MFRISHLKKRPAFLQKSPTSPQKSPPDVSQFDVSHLSYKKEPSVPAKKEPYIHTKKALKEPYTPAKRAMYPCTFLMSRILSAKEP